MKLLIIGLGSMGKRRIRCLKRLGIDQIIGFDPREDRQREVRDIYSVRTVGDWQAAQQQTADAWIISTPPDAHLLYALQAIERKVSFFTEAGVLDERLPDVISGLAASGLVGAPSCTMRYYGGPRRIKEIVTNGDIGRPLSFTYHCGQYLPDWHPWENYRDFYVSKKATGACREIVPFELCWLTDIFGPVAALSCMRGRLGDLDTDIDDVYQLLLRFSNNVIGHLMVDVLSRPAVRQFRLVATAGTVEWDQGSQTVRDYRAETGVWNVVRLDTALTEPGYLHSDVPYVHEMADFIAAVRGERPWPYPYVQDERTLDLLARAEASDEGRRHC